MPDVRFQCPNCRQTLEASPDMAGENIECPACEKKLQIPSPAAERRLVFISHAQSDHPVAEQILETLEGAGYPCWIAPRDITPGKEWGEAIIDAITQCRIMIVVYSSSSNRSKHVKRELERAVDKEVLIIPFRIEDVPMSKTMEYFLCSPHWLDAYKPPMENHLRTLLDTINKLMTEVYTGVPLSSGADLGLSPIPTAARASDSRRLIAIGSSALLATALLAGGIVWSVTKRNVSIETPAESVPQIASPDDVQSADAPRPVDPPPVVPERIQSNIALNGGNLMFRSSGFQLRFEDLPSTGDTSSMANRVVTISDQRTVNTNEYKLDSYAEVSFQLNNQSKERVTLADLQLTLLGTVQVFEDQIQKPIPPKRSHETRSLSVPLNMKPIKNYLDLSTLFIDEDTPDFDLEYGIARIGNSNLVRAVVTEGRILNLGFASGQTGSTLVLVYAMDPFGQRVHNSIEINVLEDDEAKVEDYIVRLTDEWRGDSMISHSWQETGTFIEAGEVGLDRKNNLGAVLVRVSLSPMEHVLPCGSGNLLPTDETLFMKPGSFQDFVLKLGCSVNMTPGTSEKPTDMLVGAKDPRRKLAVKPPEVISVLGVFMLHGRMTSEKGMSARIFSDKFFLIEMVSEDETQENTMAFVMDSGRSLSLDSLWGALANKVLPSYDETLAYSRAELCESIPEDFDTENVSVHCYYGDKTSPLRCSPTKLLSGADARFPRSNLAGLGSAILQEEPLVKERFDSWLERSASMEDKNQSQRAKVLIDLSDQVPAAAKPKKLYARVISR